MFKNVKHYTFKVDIYKGTKYRSNLHLKCDRTGHDQQILQHVLTQQNNHIIAHAYTQPNHSHASFSTYNLLYKVTPSVKVSEAGMMDRME